MEQTIGVTGMTCANCVRHVRDALGALPGVREVRVDLASGTAKLSVDAALAPDVLREALEAQEYGLT